MAVLSPSSKSKSKSTRNIKKQVTRKVVEDYAKQETNKKQMASTAVGEAGRTLSPLPSSKTCVNFS
jgi:hypothetical protein